MKTKIKNKIKMAVQNDPQVINKLVNDNIPLIKWTINRFINTRTINTTEHDELYSILLYRLYQCASRFDQEKGKFSTYAVSCMSSQIKNFWQQQHRSKSVLIITDTDNIPDKRLSQYLTSDANDMVECISRQLSERFASMLQLRHLGHTYTEIARRFNITKTRVEQIFHKIQDEYIKLSTKI